MAEIFMGAAANFIARKYGGRIEESVSVESIGTTAEAVVSNDPERLFLLLVNLSSNLMYIGFDAQVGADRGIFLAANGGSYEVDLEADMVIPTFAHYVVSAGAASDLYVVSLRQFKGHIEGGAENA